MFAVEALGSYISRGVNTVSGPFHPFGGAVDIVVVEQQDGSFKSSPWYVRFGKFQGVLKAKEKVVNICVDGVEADFHMYLDHKGVAYFLRGVDAEQMSSMLWPSSSGLQTDGQCSSDRMPIKSKSCNYDAGQSNSLTQTDVSTGKVVARTRSDGSQILGIVFESQSMKQEKVEAEEDEDGAGAVTIDSLELKRSTTDAEDNVASFLDGEGKKDPQINDNIVNSLDNPGSHEDSGLPEHNIGNSSESSFEKLEKSVEATAAMSCSTTETSTLGKSGFEGNDELNSEMSRKINEIGAANADHDESEKGAKSEIACPDSIIPVSAPLESCRSKKLDNEHAYDSGGGLLATGVSEENGPDRSCDTSETSRFGLDDFSEQAKGMQHLSSENCGEVSVHAETLRDTTEQISEVNAQPETSMLVAKEPLSVHGFVGDENCCNSFTDPMILESENLSSSTKSIVTEAYSEMFTVHPVNGSAKEVESGSVFTISRSKSICVAEDELKTREEEKSNKLRPSLELAGDSEEVPSEFSLIEAIEISRPDSSEEDQFLFGDLDDFKPREVTCIESISLDQTEKENHYSFSSEGVEAVNKSFSSNIESDSAPDKFVRENLQNDGEELRQERKSISSHIDIPRNNKVAAQEVGCMVESLPNMLSDFDDLDAQDLRSLLSRSLDSNSEPSKWLLIRKDVARCIKSARDEEHLLAKSQPTIEDSQISEELENGPGGPAVGDPSKISDASSGSWRLWPFSLSRSKKVAEPAPKNVAEPSPEKVAEPAPICTTDINADNALESTSGRDAEKDVPNEKVRKHTIRANSPTSEQLASLNLKEGRNTVTFTFLTSMLGEQQVDARIYLWRWDARIVISDVDGTITKSDILGQFMPLVGKDWSHTGVAHLFSAIKENGYQMLFLSARAISQAYLTRQFLFNLKQDGIALPDGPVVISPDGLFPSLFREVIRRAPHEFKIACLEDIKALFPSDRNPFYAGFGNRDTDEISYLKVGIPKGKIFIINPKGEVVVNRSVDTKSYTSLKALVSRMFPPPSMFEQEDFNSWNFWKLPPPAIDI